MESEALSVEARAHDTHDDTRRANQGNDFDVLALSYRHYICSRIGNGRTASLADDAHRMTLPDRVKVAVDIVAVSVLVELKDGQLIDVDALLDFLQETACRTDILDNKVLYADDDLTVVRWQHLLYRGVAEGHGNEIEGSHGREKGWRLEPGQRAELLAAFEIILEEEAEAAALRDLCAIDGTGKVFAARGFKSGTEAAVFASGPHHGLEVVQLSLE